MILVMISKVQHECDAIRINLLPQKFADDRSSMESKQAIVHSAKQMGSYIVVMRKGIPEQLIDPNSILSILTNTITQSPANELRK